MNKQIDLSPSVNTSSGIETTNNLKMMIVRDLFLTTDANTEVVVKHIFKDRVPIVLQGADGNNGVVYQSTTTASDKGSLYLMSTTANNPITLVLL